MYKLYFIKMVAVNQRYSSAFAFGLIENGFNRGDKLLLWVDQTNSAEILVAQVI